MVDRKILNFHHYIKKNVFNLFLTHKCWKVPSDVRNNQKWKPTPGILDLGMFSITQSLMWIEMLSMFREDLCLQEKGTIHVLPLGQNLTWLIAICNRFINSNKFPLIPLSLHLKYKMSLNLLRAEAAVDPCRIRLLVTHLVPCLLSPTFINLQPRLWSSIWQISKA